MCEYKAAQVLDDCYSAVADDYRDHIFGAAVYRVCIRNEVSGEGGREDRGGMCQVRCIIGETRDGFKVGSDHTCQGEI